MITRICMVVIGLLALASGMVLAAYQTQTITLRTSEWECTGKRLEGKVTYTRIDNVNVAKTTYKEVCIEYTKKSELAKKPNKFIAVP